MLPRARPGRNRTAAPRCYRWRFRRPTRWPPPRSEGHPGRRSVARPGATTPAPAQPARSPRLSADATALAATARPWIENSDFSTIASTTSASGRGISAQSPADPSADGHSDDKPRAHQQCSAEQGQQPPPCRQTVPRHQQRGPHPGHRVVSVRRVAERQVEDHRQDDRRQDQHGRDHGATSPVPRTFSRRSRQRCRPPSRGVRR